MTEGDEAGFGLGMAWPEVGEQVSRKASWTRGSGLSPEGGHGLESRGTVVAVVSCVGGSGGLCSFRAWGEVEILGKWFPGEGQGGPAEESWQLATLSGPGGMNGLSEEEPGFSFKGVYTFVRRGTEQGSGAEAALLLNPTPLKWSRRQFG